MEILLTILLIALIVYVGFWIIDSVGLPHPVNFIAKAAVGLIGLYALLTKTGLLSAAGL